MADSYVPLRVRSDYTTCDGATQIAAYVRRLKEIGAPAGALTDRGTLSGAYEFVAAAKAAGIKPIVGLELDVIHREGESASRETILLIARTRAGFGNLAELSRLGMRRGTPGDGHAVSADELLTHAGDLLALVGAPGSAMGRALLAGDKAAVAEAGRFYQQAFGRSWALEAQALSGSEHARLNELLVALSRAKRLPIVATSDACFLTAADHAAQETKAALQRNLTIADEDRPRTDPLQYVQSTDELRANLALNPDTWGSAADEIIAGTHAVAAATDLDLTRERFHLPRFPLPEGVADEYALLEREVAKGAIRRYGKPLPEAVQERIRYELSIIRQLGFPGYFLVVSDLVRWAKENGVLVGPGRGSAAGSIVSYCTGITDLCPIEHRLLFERFLNPDRPTLPDIDLDFDPEGRDRVREYIRERYGKDAVSQIATFNRLQAKAVFRRVAGAFGIDKKEIDRAAKSIKDDWDLAAAHDGSHEIRRFAETHAEAWDVMRRLEGQVANESVHPAGVVVAPGAVRDFVPVAPLRQDRGHADAPDSVTQFDMSAVEALGLVKIDLLSISSLTVLRDAGQMIRENHGVQISFEGSQVVRSGPEGEIRIPFDEDQATFDLLRAGHTKGLFQIEKDWVAKILKKMQIGSFRELTAALALIRPGPLALVDDYVARKTGAVPVTYAHPDLEGVLADTYGIFVYQEQLMEASRVLAGFSGGQAESLRKAVAKKDEALIEAELGRFRDGMVAKGYDAELAATLAEQFRSFGAYGFNRSHAAAYAQIAYMSAYLKAHFPAEFLAARLNKESSVVEIGEYVEDLRRLGVPVVGPDVNRSMVGYAPEPAETGQVVRVGLAALRGIGESLAQKVVNERHANGAFLDLGDFVRRMEGARLNRLHLETLALAGALDGFGERAALAAAADAVLKEARRSAASTQPKDALDLIARRQGFRIPEGEEPVAPLTHAEKAEHELRLIGIVVSEEENSYLCREAASLVRQNTVDSVADGKDSDRVVLVGQVSAVSRREGKGQPMTRFRLSDETGSVDCVTFGRTAASEAIADNATVRVAASISDYRGKRNLKVWEIAPLAVDLRITLTGDQEELLHEVGETLRRYPGQSRVIVSRPAGRPKAAGTQVTPSDALLRDLRLLLGREAVDVAAPARAIDQVAMGREKSRTRTRA